MIVKAAIFDIDGTLLPAGAARFSQRTVQAPVSYTHLSNQGIYGRAGQGRVICGEKRENISVFPLLFICEKERGLLRRIVKMRSEKRLNRFDKEGIINFKLGCYALFVTPVFPKLCAKEGAAWNRIKDAGSPVRKDPVRLSTLIRPVRKELEAEKVVRNRFFPFP